MRFIRVVLAILFVPVFSLDCAPSRAAALDVLVLGDMEKPTGDEPIKSSPHFFQNETITLHGARNEVLGFQILLRATEPQSNLDVRISDLAGPATLPADPNIQFFLTHYETARDASYSWGPGYGALPWQGKLWPDALIPFRDPYDPAHPSVAAPFAIDPAKRPNQAVWIDLLIPKDSPPGSYKGSVFILQNSQAVTTLPLQLTVHGFTLPDENHVDAFGELYGPNGVMFDTRTVNGQKLYYDETVYRRYQQMAHAHRFLATLRAAEAPAPKTLDGSSGGNIAKKWGSNWANYLHGVQPVLDGKLFTAEHDYVGPCVGAGPSFYPAPFPQSFSGGELQFHLNKNGGKLDPALLEAIEHNAAAFWSRMSDLGWGDKRFFAYIFDEVDGGVDTGEKSGGKPIYAQVHQAMRDVQAALDRGAGGPHIHLLWTSHADAAKWAGTEADISGAIRWWSPNADAVKLPFYQKILAQPGRRVWFYHSGQPAIGNHSINQLGIDLRTWGLACRRYNLSGSFWWSMMCFPAESKDAAFNPYANPFYKTDDTRWGNGVLFYPGSRLTMIGAARSIEGPIPSLRMKAYRRGLQDYEYCWLADQAGKRSEVDALLKRLVPSAFSEAPHGKPGSWSKNPEDYYAWREKMAELLK